MDSGLRPWQRLGWRLAALFALATLLAVALVGAVVHERQKREVEETVGAQLLNIARVGALLVDPRLHAQLQARPVGGSATARRLEAALAAMQAEVLLATPVYTLDELDPARRTARLLVTSDASTPPGQRRPLAPEVVQPLAWTFADGVARFTRIYRSATGTWISAFAPIGDPAGGSTAVLAVDYPVEIYVDRLAALQGTIAQGTLVGGLGALVLGLLFARRLTRPLRVLTAGATRVAAGDLTLSLPVTSRDEVGRLTRAFNDMVEGLRQRDFIRSTFGRYVSPEVARTLLESPDGLRLGGDKRVVTIVMSDLRGYTRFAEQGDPAEVMAVLNAYLGRMADILIEHGGTINEFIGDAIFAIFGAPLAQADHTERAAAAALAMQQAMATINRDHVGRGLPRFEMGIGINTGEAVVGNIGSEQRAKYAAVGSAVNVAARVESVAVGGQILLSAVSYAAIRPVAEVTAPIVVELKGLAEPLELYELRGLGGRFARRLAARDPDDLRQADVALPLTCWVIDGKVVARQGIPGVVERLGPTHLDVRLDVPLAALADVRLRLNAPGAGDLYGKVTAGAADLTPGRARIHLTSVAPHDRDVLDRLRAHSAIG